MEPEHVPGFIEVTLLEGHSWGAVKILVCISNISVIGPAIPDVKEFATIQFKDGRENHDMEVQESYGELKGLLRAEAFHTAKMLARVQRPQVEVNMDAFKPLPELPSREEA